MTLCPPETPVERLFVIVFAVLVSPVENVSVAPTLTVQFVSPGAHVGSSVSPGVYADPGGVAYATTTENESPKRSATMVCV